MKRRAVLFGVGEFSSPSITDLPAVNKDVEMLSQRFESAGYEVRPPHVGGIGRTDLGRLFRSGIKDPGADIVVVVFSGHGVHFEGQDYLVPSDVMAPAEVLDAEDMKGFQESLVLLDFASAIEASPAHTVILIVDACREGLTFGSKSLDPTKSLVAGWGSKTQRRVAGKRSALVLACTPGDVARVSNDGTFSLFSRALADALALPQRPNTLGELTKATDDLLAGYFARERKEERKSRVSIRVENAANDPYERWVLFDGETQAPRVQANALRQALTESLLWQRHFVKQAGADPLAEVLLELADRAWSVTEAASTAVPGDRWTDAQLPGRVLDQTFRLATLCELLGDRVGQKLNVDEIALLLAAPLVRELVLAHAKLQLASCEPCFVDGEELAANSKALWSSHLSRPQLVRQAGRARERGDIAASEAIAAWLMHAKIHRDPEIWRPPGADADWIPEWAEDLVRKSRVVTEVLAPSRLIELARAIMGAPEGFSRSDTPHALRTCIEAGGGPMREQLLAYLLCLAGWTAIDPRYAPQVVPEHAAVADPFMPEQFIALLQRIAWQPRAHARVLEATCEHPAALVALRAYVEHADAALRMTAAKAEGPAVDPLRHLPPRLAADGVAPIQRGGMPVFDPDPLRFELAQDEVRELLMGEQLYGDPSLAIRELYQNALDACRYREMRTRYLIARGAKIAPFKGQIEFRQAWDGNRQYIECEDNGIGMGLTELRSCFAKAGRRFHDQPEFIEEQAEWLATDPELRLYPNSQFGVGVLSYFMLGDEIEVHTCRLDRHGAPGERYVARIPGSGSLFRVEPNGRGSDAGTRVRLYLNKDTDRHARPISCRDTLHKLLWIAEFGVTVIEGGVREVWPIGTLPEWHSTQAIRTSSPRLWWSAESKGLADGIVVDDLGAKGFICNFVGPDRPRLTVSRKSAIGVRSNEWIERIAQQCWRDVLDAPWLTVIWLLRLEVGWQVLQGMALELGIRDARIKIHGYSDQSLAIREAGLFPPDEELLSGSAEFSSVDSWDNEYSAIPPCVALPRSTYFVQNGAIRHVPATLVVARPTPQSAQILSPLWPEDGVILSNDLDGKPRWFAEHFDTGRLQWIAATLGRSVQDVAARARALGGNVVDVSCELPTASQDDVPLVRASDYSRTGTIGDDVSFDFVMDRAARTARRPSAISRRLGELGIEAPAFPEDSIVPTESDVRAIHEWGLVPSSRRSAEQISLVWLRLSSARTNRSIGDVARALRSWGLEPVHVPHEIAASTVPHDAIIISLNGDGSQPWLRDVEQPVQALIVAARLQIPTTDAVRRLSSLGIECRFRRGAHAAPQLEDLVSLSAYLDGKAPWIDEVVSRAHLLAVAAASGKHPSEVARRLASLGIGCPTIAETDAIPLKEEQALLVACSVDRISRALVAAHAIDAITPFALMTRLRAMGLPCPEFSPDVPSLSEQDAALLEAARDVALSDRVSRPQLIVLSSRTSLTPLQIATKLGALGFACPMIKEDSDLVDSDEAAVWLSQNCSGYAPYFDDQVGQAQLLVSWHKLDLPIARFAAVLESWGLECASVHPKVEKPSEADIVLLSRNLNGSAPWLESAVVPIAHVLAAWATAGGELEEVTTRFKALGFSHAPLRPMKEPPSPKDLVLLSRDLNGQGPWLSSDTARPSHIRFAAFVDGRSPRAIAARLEAMGIACPAVPEPPSTSDYTLGDLHLLSIELEAEAPWIELDVPPDHVVRAEQRLSWSRSDIVTRLKELGLSV